MWISLVHAAEVCPGAELAAAIASIVRAVNPAVPVVPDVAEC
jgi:hypothetical protein